MTGTPVGTKLSVLIRDPNGPIAIALGMGALICSSVTSDNLISEHPSFLKHSKEQI
jgi:hypothetical protein